MCQEEVEEEEEEEEEDEEEEEEEEEEGSHLPSALVYATAAPACATGGAGGATLTKGLTEALWYAAEGVGGEAGCRGRPPRPSAPSLDTNWQAEGRGGGGVNWHRMAAWKWKRIRFGFVGQLGAELLFMREFPPA
jgi:hypothetical protein